MPDAAALIVDRWIREDKKVIYKFSPVVTPRTISPGKELIIADESDLRCKQGVLWMASAAASSPKIAIRFVTEDFDTEDRFRADTILESGETEPNEFLWVKAPPESPYYTGVLVAPFTWIDWAKVTLINLDDVEITVYKTLYLVAMWR